jgi:hypothetical protein
MNAGCWRGAPVRVPHPVLTVHRHRRDTSIIVRRQAFRLQTDASADTIESYMYERESFSRGFSLHSWDMGGGREGEGRSWFVLDSFYI